MSNIVPLRGLPEETLNKQVFELGVWLENILSLEGEKSTERMIVLLPMIKQSAWGLSVDEIKKAFTLYVEGKMPLEPRDNYLTVILFSKVIDCYKQTVKIREPKKIELPEMTEDQKDQIMVDAVKNAHKEYLQTGMLGDAPIGQYDWLDKKGLLQKAFKFSDFQWKHRKIEAYNATKELLKAVYQSEIKIDSDRAKDIKNILKSLENAKNGEVIAESKKMLLKEYYNTLIVEV